jgi:hypothetical protein
MAGTRSRWPIIREVILFTFGLLGLVEEAAAWFFWRQDVNPILTAVYVACVGLPGIVGTDLLPRLKSDENGKEDSPDDAGSITGGS